MLKVMIICLGLPLVMACGSSLDTGKKFRDEKDQRIEAQRELYETLSREEQLKRLTNKATATENYIWVWSYETYSYDYEDARRVCTDIGFDLPTEEMLVEAHLNEHIKKRTSSEDMSKFVYILDQPERFAVVLFCAKAR